MNNQGYWEREDGEPWESVESLPLPLPQSEIATPTPEPYPWESLESLPSPFDAEPKSSAPKEEGLPEAKEGWSFRNLPENEEDGEDEEKTEEWNDTSLSPAPPRATTVEDDIESIGGIEYIPFDRLPTPPQFPAKDQYSLHPAPPPWPYPGPLTGAKRQGPVGRRVDHPPVIPLSTLLKQLGISPPVRDLRRGRRCRQRPLSPLSPPPTKPKRSDFDIADISYEAREEKLYGDGKEINFPKVPTYLPPTAKKTESPLRGPWKYEERHMHAHIRRPLPNGYGHPAAPAVDPFWEEQARVWPRVKYYNIVLNHPNNLKPLPPVRNIGTLMREWEDQGLAKISTRRGNGKMKKPSVADGNEEEADDEEEEREHHIHDDAPSWTDKEEKDIYRQRDCQRLRCDSADAHEIDDHNLIHYPPTSAEAFNVKRIRDKAVKTFVDSSRKKSKGKGREPVMKDEDAEGIYDVSEASDSPNPKKHDPYAAFKKTTGRHPRHFHKSKKCPDQVFERFVLDRRPLADGEEEPTGKNRRRPMIDTVNLKTGERTRRKVKGYDRLSRMIRVAAGVEMLGGLPPRRKREVEKDDRGGVEGEGLLSARRKSSGGRRKKKVRCVVM